MEISKVFENIRNGNISKGWHSMCLEYEPIFRIRAYHISFDDDELRIDGVYVMYLSVALSILKKGSVLEIVDGELILTFDGQSKAIGRVKNRLLFGCEPPGRRSHRYVELYKL